MNDSELAEHVAVVLRTKAAQVTATRHGFNPAGGGVVPLAEPTVGTPGRSGGRNGWRALAAAAAVLAVVTTGVVILRASDGGSGGTETDAAAPRDEDGAVSGPPDGLLVPNWVPEGLELGGVGWHEGPPETGLGGTDATTTQLFGSEDGEANMLVEITSGSGFDPDGLSSDLGGPVTVRGQDGFDSRNVFNGRTIIIWDENDARLWVEVRGMSRDEAVAFLDLLTWRSEADPTQGFAPPEDAPLSLAGETGGTGDYQELNVELYYGTESRGVLDASSLWVRTSVPSATTPDGTFSRRHLATWYEGGQDEDGRITSVSDGALTVSWPDGRTVSMTAMSGELDEEEARKMADSVAPVTGSEFDRLRLSVSDRYASEPLVASVELPSATLEVRGGEAFRVLCVRVAEHDVTCPSELPSPGGGLTQPLASGLRIDGTWYVVAADEGGEPPDTFEGNHSPDIDALFEPGQLGDLLDVSPEDWPPLPTNPDDLRLDTETGDDGEWTFTLAIPPAEVDSVTVRFPDSEFPDGLQTFDRR